MSDNLPSDPAAHQEPSAPWNVAMPGVIWLYRVGAVCVAAYATVVAGRFSVASEWLSAVAALAVGVLLAAGRLYRGEHDPTAEGEPAMARALRAISALSTAGCAMIAGQLDITTLGVAILGAIAVLGILHAGRREVRLALQRKTETRPVVELVSQVVPFWVQHIEAARREGDHAIDDLTQFFGNLADRLSAAEEAGRGIGDRARTAEEVAALSAALRQLHDNVRAETDRLFAGFQFQDRVSQILESTSRDMSRLSELLGAAPAGGERRPDVAAWLQSLEKSYTTDEQRRAHRPGQAGAPRGKPSQERSTIEAW